VICPDEKTLDFHVESGPMHLVNILCRVAAAFMLCFSTAPAQAPVDPDKAEVAENFHPYVPETFSHMDRDFHVKCFTFSQRQLDYVAARDFDEDRFTRYLLATWPIEKLTEFTKDTPQERLPRKVGCNAGRYLEIDVYQNQKHKFDSVSVSVADQYGYSILADRSFRADADGTINEVLRWSWVICVKKGRKVWHLEGDLPNLKFEKKRIVKEEGKQQPDKL
jgi:hypothetical protein